MSFKLAQSPNDQKIGSTLKILIMIDKSPSASSCAKVDETGASIYAATRCIKNYQVGAEYNFAIMPTLPGQSNVHVNMLDGGNLVIPKRYFVKGAAKDDIVAMPDWVFHIHHQPSNKHILFDVGLGRIEEYPPTAHDMYTSWKATPPAKSLVEQLSKLGVAGKDINMVIFSHAHW